MAIQAQLPDGTTLQFPDGTPPAVVDGAVKQHISSLPGGTVETRESKLGFTPAPPEPPKPEPSPLEGSPEEAFQAGYAQSFPQPAPRPTAPPAPAPTPARGGIGDPGTLSGAVAEGFRTAPRIVDQPAIDEAERSGPVGYYINSPLMQGVNFPLQALNAAYKGGQATLESLLTPLNPILGTNFARDIAAMPEAFPTGVPEEATYSGRGTTLLRPLSAPPAPQFVQEFYGEPIPGQMGPPVAPKPPTPPTAETVVPPGTPQGPTLSRINELIQADIDQAARRPAEIPPTTTKDPVTGEVQPIQQPPNPADRSQAPQPQPEPQPTAGETAPPGAAGAPATPAPQPAGAQITPATELGLTPREEAAYRATAEGNKLLEPQEPGVRDDKQYLEGTTANEAEKSQDVQTARELKSLRQQTPELDAKMTADENNNNNIVTNSIHNALPGRRQIQVAEDARTEAMKTNEPKVFANATDADVQPIVQSIQDTLNEPKNRQNTQLGQYVRPLIDRLQNEDGTPKITDPKELWGFRQDVQHLTSKAAQVGDPNLSRVSGLLGGVLEVIDNQIEAAAPGYKAQLRDEYRTRSQEIDAMRALDDQRFKLFDSQNKPNYNAVQSLMRRIADGRKDGDPYDPYANVSATTLDKLWNIRDFMRRQVAADRLAAPKGAATSQNLGDALRAAGRMAVQNAGPVVGGTLGAMLPIPGVGPALGIVAGSAVNHLLSERAMRQRFARGLELTNPNQLMQPPSP